MAFFRVFWVFLNNYNTPIPILYPYLNSEFFLLSVNFPNLGFSHKSILLVFVFSYCIVLFFL